MLHPSYQSVLAEFSRLLSTYIVFSGRASFNWVVDCLRFVLFLTGPPMMTTRHKDPAGIYQPLARQRQLYFVLQHSQAVFFSEPNTQPSSIFLLKRMSYIRFLISTYSFTSSYTHIIILKTHEIPFSYLHPYFCCFFPPSADCFTTGFPLNQPNCPTSYLLTKTK